MKKQWITLALALTLASFARSASSDDLKLPETAPAAPSAASAPALDSAPMPENRKKSIEFDDGMVEGMNRRSRDSLSQIGDANRKHKKPHLYKKRSDFKEETADVLKDLEYQSQ